MMLYMYGYMRSHCSAIDHPTTGRCSRPLSAALVLVNADCSCVAQYIALLLHLYSVSTATT
jgi:hypothetical protein